MERAKWVARAIASAPASAIQGTVRAAWMAHELARREALAQVSSFVSLGTQYENIAEGQAAFQGERIEWRLR
jgi:enoyl-CoA hydratase/carnithine racemase